MLLIIVLILTAFQERVLIHSWEERPEGSLWAVCPADVWMVVRLLGPLLLLRTQETLRNRLSAR